MLSLWLNLRRSISKQFRNISVAEIKTIAFKDEGEIFKFPYGTKECVVHREKGNKRRRRGTRLARNKKQKI